VSNTFNSIQHLVRQFVQSSVRVTYCRMLLLPS